MYRKLTIWITLTLVLLMGYLSISFIVKESRNFSSLNYDWSNAKEVQNFGKVTVDSISDDYLRLVVSEKQHLGPTNTFNISNNNGSFYFRYTYRLVEKNAVIFKGLIWLNVQPENNKEIYVFKEIDLPIISRSQATIITLGDEQIFENEAKYFRKEIKRRKEINFIGTNKDIYGFNYYSNSTISYQELDTLYAQIPKAQILILLLKPSQNLKKELLAFKNFSKKISSDKNFDQAFIITQPIYNNNYIDYKRFNKALCEISEKNKKIKCIDIEALFGKSTLFYRGEVNEISKEGYEKLAATISKLF
ncbi:hypothetical protein ULMS_03600 [Patiriisocius marinistellae]|uniref:Uncharacterized protein n=1 Tax=Patiriisocius marinistellae TaxID=2494560 RepID=A0A5J4FUZ2_9FLAO|nr:hypothetical protein [Patiriisocius marinistellae]GEQ84852.1 hypothetical protein ULMS_03600 [Patiriisocius marinistellae]